MFLSREMRALALLRTLDLPGIDYGNIDRKRLNAFASRIDEIGGYHSPNVADAQFNSVEMAAIAANFGGGIQAELKPSQVGGRERVATGSFVFAAQASGSTIWLTRVPLPCRITGITLLVDTSTATATLALGDKNSAALFAAASVYTTVDVPQRIGKTSAYLNELTTGYDAQTGNQVTYANNQGYGALYDDIIATTAVAALPGSGNLVVVVEYVID